MYRHFPYLLFLLVAIPNAHAGDGFPGVYAGVQGGYVDGFDSGKEYSSGVFDDYTQESNLDGGLLGIFAGYNFVFTNNFMAGLEGDFEGRFGTDEDTFQQSSGVIDTTYPYKAESNMAASLRARLGYIYNVNTLFFITGGYAGVEVDRAWFDTTQPGVSSSSTDWLHGWTIGAGIERVILSNFAVKLEYRFSDYAEETISSANVYGAGYTERQEFDEHTIKLGVSYLFP